MRFGSPDRSVSRLAVTTRRQYSATSPGAGRGANPTEITPGGSTAITRSSPEAALVVAVGDGTVSSVSWNTTAGGGSAGTAGGGGEAGAGGGGGGAQPPRPGG